MNTITTTGHNARLQGTSTTHKDAYSMTVPPLIQNTDGNALLSVLVISLWMFIILAILISISHMQYRIIKTEGFRIKARYLALAGIHHSVAEPSFTGGLLNRDRIYEFPDGTARVHRYRWGGYWRYQSIGECHGQTKTLTALCGQRLTNELQSAVILGQLRYPLILAGTAAVSGDCHTGPGGVREGILKGEPFKGKLPPSEHIHSEDKVSLPRFDPMHGRQAIADVQRAAIQADGEKIYNSLDLSEPEQISNLTSSALFIQGDIDIGPFITPVTLSACTLMATGSIRIHDNARFPEWTVLYARNRLEIQGGTWHNALMVCEGDLVIRGPIKGSLQALSRSTLTVQGPAELTWPSLLAVDTGGKNSTTPLLTLEGESFIAGSILLLDQPVPEESIGRNRITIGTGTKIHGLVYTSAWCDFRGRLHGCLACNATWFYRSPTTYINWLYNTTIDSHLLEEDFIIPMGFGGEERVLFELRGEGERE